VIELDTGIDRRHIASGTIWWKNMATTIYGVDSSSWMSELERILSDHGGMLRHRGDRWIVEFEYERDATAFLLRWA
jgi:hypothetical protein